MDWTVYWFQSIACFVFAAVAMFSGISGAALMLPWFVMGFAILGVPEITTQQAVAAALFLETAAFAIGIYRYTRRKFIDTATAPGTRRSMATAAGEARGGLGRWKEG